MKVFFIFHLIIEGFAAKNRQFYYCALKNLKKNFLNLNVVFMLKVSILLQISSYTYKCFVTKNMKKIYILSVYFFKKKVHTLKILKMELPLSRKHLNPNRRCSSSVEFGQSYLLSIIKMETSNSLLLYVFSRKKAQFLTQSLKQPPGEAEIHVEKSVLTSEFRSELTSQFLEQVCICFHNPVKSVIGSYPNKKFKKRGKITF